MKKGVNTYRRALSFLEKSDELRQLGHKPETPAVPPSVLLDPKTLPGSQAFGPEQAELYHRLRREVVQPHLAHERQAAYFASGGNVAPLLVGADFDSAVMVDERKLGYGQTWTGLESEETSRENYYKKTIFICLNL